MSGKLYIVATPIGNLADITLRALSVLKEVDLIAAEDTRITHNLLKHYEIDTPSTPYHQHSIGRKARQLLNELKKGKNIAIVSDAGTPGISDPGEELILMAIDNEIEVISIPGPSAIITALVVSGLTANRFIFDGFPPRRPSERKKYFQSLENETRTMIFYESPHRLLSTLKDMREAWGNRQIAVIREATKLFEEVHRGTVDSSIERFTSVKAKGEITIVAAGSSEVAEEITPEIIKKQLSVCMSTNGLTDRDAVREVSEKLSISKKEVYRIMLDMKGDMDEE